MEWLSIIAWIVIVFGGPILAAYSVGHMIKLHLGTDDGEDGGWWRRDAAPEQPKPWDPTGWRDPRWQEEYERFLREQECSLIHQ